MSFRIVPLIEGSAPVIVLGLPVLLVGRHLDCDIQLSSPKVSRRHCCFAMAYDRVLIRDLGSRNGIRVNGEAVEESRLYEGDELAIGPILFRFEAHEENPQTAVPASRPVPAPSGPSVRPPMAAAPTVITRREVDIDLIALDDT